MSAMIRQPFSTPFTAAMVPGRGHLDRLLQWPSMRKTGDFVDEARIHTSGGDGGNGAASFRREKYRPKGGPDGGNGGPGGAVILRVTPGVATLAEVARAPHVRAERGKHGGGSDKHGSAGPDRVVPIP